MSQTIKELFQFENSINIPEFVYVRIDWNQGVFVNYLQVPVEVQQLAVQGQQVAVEERAEGWP